MTASETTFQRVMERTGPGLAGAGDPAMDATAGEGAPGAGGGLEPGPGEVRCAFVVVTLRVVYRGWGTSLRRGGSLEPPRDRARCGCGHALSSRPLGSRTASKSGSTFRMLVPLGPDRTEYPCKSCRPPRLARTIRFALPP